MPVPSPRNKILPARGAIADLQTNVDALVEGEICYAIDLDQYYQKEDGVLVAVGPTIAQGELADSAVQTVNGKTGPDVIIDKSDIGLSNVDNTADIDKPISTSTQAALDLKADLVDGKVPSSQLPDSVSGDYLSLAPDAPAQTVESTNLTTFKGDVTSEGGVIGATGTLGGISFANNAQTASSAFSLNSGGQLSLNAGGTGRITFRTKGGSNEYRFFRSDESSYGDLRFRDLTANRTYQFPDAAGTIALTSDFSALPDTGDGNPQSDTLDDRYLMLTADAGDQTVESTGLTTFKGGVTSEGTVTAGTLKAGNLALSGNKLDCTAAMTLESGGTSAINFKTKNANGNYNFFNTAGDYYAVFRIKDITANRVFTYPDAGGTIALTSDIPSVSGNYLSLASDAGDQNVLSTDVTSFAGKVGIGTDAPSSMLHVTDTDGVSRIAKFETTGTAAFIELQGSNTTTPIVIGKTADDTNLYTNDVKRLTINMDGDVGINTTAPATKLAVVETDAYDPISDGTQGANLLLRRNMDNADRVEGAYGASITFTKINGNNAAASIATVMGSDEINQQDIVFLTHPTTDANRLLEEAMRITATGNVGIGTDDPLAKLEVQGDVNIGTSGVAGPYGAFFFPITAGNSIFYQYNDDSNNFTLGRGAVLGSNKLVSITPQGNVGIGTDDPQELLDVNGSSKFRNTILLEKSAPVIQFIDTAAAANEKTFAFRNSGGSMTVQALDDAGAGGGNNFRFNRSGNNINSFTGRNAGTSWYTVDNLNRKVTNTGDCEISGTIKATSIQFPTATSNTPGLSAVVQSNLLDDYEEGTFTPAITTGTATDVVYNANNVGNYVKVGNLVTASIRLQTASGTLVTGTSNNFTVTLPFASFGWTGHVGVGTIGRNNMLTGFNELGCRTGANSVNLVFYNGNTVIKTDAAGVALGNRILEISITYRVK